MALPKHAATVPDQHTTVFIPFPTVEEPSEEITLSLLDFTFILSDYQNKNISDLRESLKNIINSRSSELYSMVMNAYHKCTHDVDKKILLPDYINDLFVLLNQRPLNGEHHEQLHHVLKTIVHSNRVSYYSCES